MERRLVIILSVIVGLLLPALHEASAHPLAPAYLELNEVAPGQFDVLFKRPLTSAGGVVLTPSLPRTCNRDGSLDQWREKTALIQRYVITCANGSLRGDIIGLDGLVQSGTDAVVVVNFTDGARAQATLRDTRTTFVVPEQQTFLSTLIEYGRLGVEHISSGIDHLLFVLGLILLVGQSSLRLLKVITAFTLGHSISLSVVALGAVQYPVGLVEIFIAISVYLLAVEVIRSPSGKPSFLGRYPWAASAGFGLLHGFGFAGALAEIGLPKDEIAAALMGFNLGIEIGQVLFVSAILLVWSIWTFLVQTPLPSWVRLVPAYSIGTAGSYWFADRAISAVF